MQRLSRPALSALRSPALRQVAPRRFASTASPADKSRSWKSSALRWGLAVGAVYYYTTSSVFADEATPLQATFSAAPSSFPTSDTKLPTVESVLEEKRKQNTPPAPAAESKPKTEAPKNEPENTTEAAPAGSPADLEEEAGQQGAFDPETGEINWDCPCLGGMAHGPCGEEFKAAFSCFVHSTEEPKGMDCIEKFQGMQECFRKYPEIYGAELADDEDAEPDFGEDAPEPTDAAAPAVEKVAEPESTTAAPVADDKTPEPEAKIQIETKSEPKAVEAEVKTSEKTGPKWEDATGANDAAPVKKD